jgi:hypothetical protein
MKIFTKYSAMSHKVGTDFLWFAIIFLGGLFLSSLVPLVPNDFWWHLKIGEWIYTHHEIPTTNIFSWTLPTDAQFYYGAWLGEYLLYLIYRMGGLELTIFTRNLLLGITFLLIGIEAKRLSGSWRISGLVIAIGFAMIINNVIVRTQIWSWVPFVIFLVLLMRFSNKKLSKKWLLFLPLTMVFWVNVHGAYVLGLIMLGIYFIGEYLRFVFKNTEALSKDEILWLALISFLTFLATIINPRSYRIVEYILGLMTDQPSQQLVVEWQSPTPAGFSNIIFFASIILLIILLVYSKHSITPTVLLSIVVFLWLGWSGVRYIVWYALLILPIFAILISQLPIKLKEFPVQRNLINLLIVLLLLLPVLLVQPWFVEKFPLPHTYHEQVLSGISIGPLLSTDTPVAVVEYIKTHPGGKLFNEMGYGSYLIWAVPEQGVFIDPRVELYPLEQWQDYLQVSSGVDYNQILNSYGADRILLSKGLQSKLAQAIADDPLWRLEYEDQYSQIWTKIIDETP